MEPTPRSVPVPTGRLALVVALLAVPLAIARVETWWVLLFGLVVVLALIVGDLVATPVTGAYGRSMGSNYNMITRPPVVFVRDGDARLVVRRETFDDLLATDVG